MLSTLVLTGWFKSTVSKIGGARLTTLYLLLTLLLLFIYVPITPFWKINVGGFLLPLIAIPYLLRKEEEKVYVISATFLLGTVYFLSKELIYIEPVLLIANEVIQFSFLVTLIAFIIGTRTENQFVIIFGGVLLGDILFNLNHQTVAAQSVIGNAFTTDIIWLAILQVILIKGFTYEIKMLIKKVISFSIRTR